MIGTIVGNRYRIEERIGGGGMALVYRATDMQLSRDVAVKVLRGQFGSDEEFIRRFRREAQNAASLSHPNVVQIYDVGEENDLYYIVMELVRGKTLKALIQEQGPLPVGEAARIAIEILGALHHAHTHRIVHRDIKPHNILIAQDGRVKVTDFGIARATTTDTVTHTGSIMGSAHYFSPEQANGLPTGEKSDIYSLGVVLYEMVTGTVPFQGESPITVALKHLRDRVTPPSELNAEVPLELDEIVLQAMEKDPDDRYESAEAMQEALEEFQAAHAAGQTHIHAGDFPTMDLRAMKVRQREKEKPKGREQEQNQKKRRRTWILGGGIALLFLLAIGTAVWALTRFFNVPEVQVPDVRNLHYSEAQQVLRQHKLNPLLDSEQYSDLELNHVIATRPDPNATVKQGSDVRLVVSKGPEKREVPNVVGQTLAQAKAALESARFTVGKVDQRVSPEPEGKVLEMLPAPRTTLDVGATIDLVVSKGPLRVPNIVGKSLADATQALAEAGLQVGNVAPKGDPQPKGTVISSNPAPGSAATAGQRVDLVVSEGPDAMTKEFNRDLIVPGAASQKVRFQVILVETVGGQQDSRLLVNETLAGQTKVPVKVQYAGEAYLSIKVDDVERQRIELP